MYRCPKCKGNAIQALVWVEANLYPDAPDCFQMEYISPLPNVDAKETQWWCCDCEEHLSPVIEMEIE